MRRDGADPEAQSSAPPTRPVGGSPRTQAAEADRAGPCPRARPSGRPAEPNEPGDAAPMTIATETLFGLMLLPVRAPIARLEASARAADAAGFDSLWLFDHLDTPHAEIGAPTLDVYEGWTTATILAARTERIHIGHNVLCASFRHPALLAKMAATLDVATCGR